MCHQITDMTVRPFVPRQSVSSRSNLGAIAVGSLGASVGLVALGRRHLLLRIPRRARTMGAFISWMRQCDHDSQSKPWLR